MNQRDPSERFKTLAANRVNNVLKGMKSLGKLANRRNYEYSDADAKKIIQSIKSELKSLEASFEAERQGSGPFKL